MTTFENLKKFFAKQDFKLVIAADGETRVTQKGKNGKREKIVSQIPAGGVGITFDSIALASSATYIGRAKSRQEKNYPRVTIKDRRGTYSLKRVFLDERELDNYYYGFSNQTLWPLCHVAFERPVFKREWYEGFKKINQRFAKAIQEEIEDKTFVWVNDYQLSLVPKLLDRPKNTIVGMFWHIPWPTWEAFRILPFKKEILESLLMCDFLAFHRGYHVANFFETIRRELPVRIDEETNKVYYGDTIPTTVKNLPMGIDTDVVTSLIPKEPDEPPLLRSVKKTLGLHQKREGVLGYFDRYRIILGVDRLDYTKGFLLRLEAIDRFFQKYPGFVGKAMYVGVIAPSRDAIPIYAQLKAQVEQMAHRINAKYGRNGWKPVEIVYQFFPRKEIIAFYRNASVCLVTPRDDGMNLVSKEFVMASSFADNPGMLVLSRFAGSAIDLTSALIINPYDIEEVADNIKKGLEMSKSEKRGRIARMVGTLEERNVYAWAQDFVENAIASKT